MRVKYNDSDCKYGHRMAKNNFILIIFLESISRKLDLKYVLKKLTKSKFHVFQWLILKGYNIQL